MSGRCEIRYASNAQHIQPIFAGFLDLERSGALRCRWVEDPAPVPHATVPDELADSWHARVRVILDAGIRVVFDTHDSEWIDPIDLAWCHRYFKRSYRGDLAVTLTHGDRLRPLGLNFPIHPARPSLRAAGRAWRFDRGKEKIFHVLAALGFDGSAALCGGHVSRSSNILGRPDTEARPRALLMTRTWEPGSQSRAWIREEVHLVNEQRAACIRALRDAFDPDRFHGGLSHTGLARKRYPDCLLPEGKDSSRGRYMRTVSRFPIGVTTKGLFDSTGWRFGEYVTQAKAIVAEEMRFEVPGPFAEGRNYLAFRTPQECVAQVQRLIEDRDLRCTMMQANLEYAAEYVVPERVITRCLRVARGEEEMCVETAEPFTLEDPTVEPHEPVEIVNVDPGNRPGLRA